MGLVINKTIDALTIEELYAHLKIEPARQGANRPRPVHFGGPVDPGRGFVLHSADYREDGTLGIGEAFAMTATLDILRAMGKGEGPRQSLLALGYAGWAPGQLDAEIQANGWLLGRRRRRDRVRGGPTTANGSARLPSFFGVSPSMLSTDAGHA